MIKLFSVTLFSALFIQSALCSDYLLAIGAGGEDPNLPTTIFDSAFKNLSGYVQSSPGLKGDIALNGGHSTTEGIRDSFPSNVGKSSFYSDDYQRLIQTYKTKLENNEMVQGDQFMIYIDSHGAAKVGNQNTHYIATSGAGASNLKNLEGSKLVDLEQLEVLKKLAKEKGVKMAIVDMSCFSGNTLALADDNTCVISSTGTNHYGYSSFSDNFSEAMKKGKSLEEVFLEVRANHNAPAFPMISTEAGLAMNSLIYDKISEFLFNKAKSTDNLTDYLVDNHSEQKMCIANQKYNSLLKTIDDIEKLNTVTKKSLWGETYTSKEVDLSNLKNLLQNYKKSLDTAAVKMRELDTDRFNRLEYISASVQINQYTTTMDEPFKWKDLINSNYDKIIETFKTKAADPTIDVLTKTETLTALAYYQKAKEKKEEIIKNNPDLLLIPAKQEEIAKSIGDTYDIARDIATEERKLYQTQYKSFQKQKPDTQNACQKFKL